MVALFELPKTIGRYRIEQVVGHGAMGRVVLAKDPVLERAVAIKALRTDLGIDTAARDALLQRMRHEARAVARVSHPNIVTLHDMLQDPELGLCLVFEYVSGTTLRERLSQGPLPLVEAARLTVQTSSAIGAAHEAGVVHRDIKPDNIMLAEHGAKIADFGIARVPDSTLTHAGGLFGTPAYSAPETIAGQNFSPASDQFSLAATLYEALSATRAFPGDDAATVAGFIATCDPKPFAASLGLHEDVDRVLLRAMSKNPDHRFASCREFGTALTRALTLSIDKPSALAGFATSVTPLASLALACPPATSAKPAPINPPVSAAAAPDRYDTAAAPRPIGLWASVALGGAAIGALIAIVTVFAFRPAAPTPWEIVHSRFDSAPAAGTADAAAPSPTESAKTKPKGKPSPSASPSADTPSDNPAAAVPEPRDASSSDAQAPSDPAADLADPGEAPDAPKQLPPYRPNQIP